VVFPASFLFCVYLLCQFRQGSAARWRCRYGGIHCWGQTYPTPRWDRSDIGWDRSVWKDRLRHEWKQVSRHFSWSSDSSLCFIQSAPKQCRPLATLHQRGNFASSLDHCMLQYIPLLGPKKVIDVSGKITKIYSVSRSVIFPFILPTDILLLNTTGLLQ